MGDPTSAPVAHLASIYLFPVTRLQRSRICIHVNIRMCTAASIILYVRLHVYSYARATRICTHVLRVCMSHIYIELASRLSHSGAGTQMCNLCT